MYTGPHIIKDGLVFGYDTGYGIADNDNATRFYPGEKTTNLADTDAKRNFGAHGGNSCTTSSAPEYGPGWKKLTVTNIAGNNSRVAQLPYLTQPSGGTRTYSIEYDVTGLTGYKLKVDGTGGYSIVSIQGKGRHSATISSVSQNSSLALFLIKSGTHTNINEVVYYRYYQVEVNSHATPFVDGTRSSTASLIDLKETTDIDVSNVSFDSTGQPEFDGTNDRIVSDAILVEGSQTFEAVFTPTENAHSPTAILTNHSYTSPVANFGINYVSGNKLGASIGYTDGTREYDQKITSGAVWVNGSNVAVHVVFTYNATANQIKWYINGELDATYNLSKTPNFQSIPVCSGSWVHNYNDYWFGGQIHVGKIYNRELSATEAKQNFNAYKNRFSI
jgi:hypothetical protein